MHLKRQISVDTRLLLLIIYSASVAGEETLHTYSYVQSHIRHTVKNKNDIDGDVDNDVHGPN